MRLTACLTSGRPSQRIPTYLIEGGRMVENGREARVQDGSIALESDRSSVVILVAIANG